MTIHGNAGLASDFATGRSSSSQRRPGVARRLWCFVYYAWFRARTRHALRNLPDHLLADVGLSRDDVANEVIKPFWR
ncbi:DUF1127 domain-containing protein [Ancylobacter terrae]|uniref:DUF1127 domain-containing protein n=1 Tax=Ancylobacter sp. sgz301288 TaxID=3342077 RepID=UPI003858921C